MKADEILVPLDASPLAEGAPLRPDPDLHARAAEATTLPAADPSDAEGEVVGEAASYLKLFVACCGGGWSATRSRESIAARAVTGHDANSAMTRIAKRRSS